MVTAPTTGDRDGTSVLVAATTAPWKLRSSADHGTAWLHHFEDEQANADQDGHDVGVLLVAETDGSDLRAYAPLARRLHSLDGQKIMFDLDLSVDGPARQPVTSDNRLARICTGRNLIQYHALLHGWQWVLFLDTDVCPPPGVVRGLLDLGHPFCGFSVAGYGLDGPKVTAHRGPRDADVRAHWNTAGALLVHRSVFSRVAWGWDPDAGLTDDPAYAAAVRRTTGHDCYVRHDLVGRHVDPLVAVEHRNWSWKR